MPLNDSTSLEQITYSAAESLPDPTTVSGRVYRLVNGTGGPAVTWSSSGPATPFNEDGTDVATISLGQGQSKWVWSNGSRWVVVRQPQTGRRIVSAKGVTDGSGSVTVNFTPPFPTVPVVTN